MQLAYQIVVTLHVVFAALWFGAPLGSLPGLRMAASSGREAFVSAAKIAERSGAMAALGTLGVLVTGVALIFVRFKGFGEAPPRFHAALGLVMVALVLGLAAQRPLVSRLVTAAQSPDWTPATTDPMRKRLAMFGGISHAIWLVCLILMYTI